MPEQERLDLAPVSALSGRSVQRRATFPLAALHIIAQGFVYPWVDGRLFIFGKHSLPNGVGPLAGGYLTALHPGVVIVPIGHDGRIKGCFVTLHGVCGAKEMTGRTNLADGVQG